MAKARWLIKCDLGFRGEQGKLLLHAFGVQDTCKQQFLKVLVLFGKTTQEVWMPGQIQWLQQITLFVIFIWWPFFHHTQSALQKRRGRISGLPNAARYTEDFAFVGA